MKFEEQFPNLKDKSYWMYDSWTLEKEKITELGDGEDSLFYGKDIKKHCLDKQRVKEAIEEHSANYCVFCGYTKETHEKMDKCPMQSRNPSGKFKRAWRHEHSPEDLLKELGLK